MGTPKKRRLIIKGFIVDFFVLILQLGNMNLSSAAEITDKEILKNSQISYRAEGGFSTVQSYGVILSCVNGRVSVLKSIYDPRLSADKARSREVGEMPVEQYVELWNNLDRYSLLKMQDAPRPKNDIQDEFTIHFAAKVGKLFHEFDVYGISRPESARYFAVRKMIDDSVQMKSLWETHQHLARHLDDKPLTAEKAN